MSSVDQRVVQMQFDNQQFEKGAKTTESTLERLRKSLNLDGATKGLENLDAAAKKGVSLDGIASDVDNISSKFSAFSIIAITALAKIASSAMDAGAKMLKALTLDPIINGFKEYELQMGAIKVIMANLGDKVTMAQVNQALDELNEYADLTIYNFGQMTDAVGKFTAAGVGLDDATAAIKGLSNMAAGAGVSNARLAGAYIQVSQALQAGVFRLQDWNSMQAAGLANTEFREQLMATAREMGTLTGNVDNFRESLKSGWLTTDVFLRTMNKAADPTNEWGKRLYQAATEVTTFTQMVDTLKEALGTGWATTMEAIIGDFDEARVLWTNINDVLSGLIGTMSDARNESLAYWKANGGRDKLLDALTNAFKGLQSILKPISDAFKQIFPAKTGQDLIDLTKKIQDLFKNFKIGSETANNLRRTFAGLFAVFSIGGKLLKGLWSGFWELVKAIFPAVDGVLGFTGSIGDFIVMIDKAIGKGTLFQKVFQGLGAIIKPVATIVSTAFYLIGDAISSILGINEGGITGFFDRIKSRLEPLGAIGGFVGKVFQEIAKVFSWFVDAIKTVGTVLGKLFTAIKNTITGALDEGSFSGLFDLVNGGLMGGLIIGITGFIKNLSSGMKSIGSFLDSFKSILDGVSSALNAFTGSIKAKTLLKIAGAIALLAVALLVIATIDSDKLTGSLAAISVLFVELVASMTLFEKTMSGKGYKTMGKATSGMIKMSVAILLLAIAMKTLSSLDWNGVAKGLTSVAALMAMLVASAKLLESVGPGLNKVAFSMILFAAAINLLVGPVMKLAKLSWVELAKGLGAVAVMLGLFVAAASLLKNNTAKLMAISFSMILFAVAIKLLVGPITELAKLSWIELAKGLGAVALILGMFVGVAALLNMNVAELVGTAASMILFAVAIKILTTAVIALSQLSWEDLGKGMAAVAVMMGMFVGAANLMPDSGRLIAFGLAMILVAASMNILSTSLIALGAMSWEAIAAGLVAMAGMLIIIVGAMLLMTTALPGAAALLIVSAALLVLTGVLFLLGSIPIETIITGMAAMAAMFIILGVAGLVLAPLTLILLGLSAAMLLFGVGMLSAGLGLVLLATGLGMLGSVGMTGVAALALLGLAIIPLALLAPVFLVVGAALLVFGAAVVILALGLLALSAAFTALSVSTALGLEALTQVSQKIAEIAPQTVEILALGAAFVVFGLGAAAAGVGCLALGLGLMLLAGGLALMAAVGDAGMLMLQKMADLSWELLLAAPAFLGAGAAMLVFGAGALVAGAGALLAGSGFLVLSAGMLLFGAIEGSVGAAILALSGASLALVPIGPILLVVGAAMLTFAAGALLAGAASLVLGPGLAVLGTGLTALSTSLNNGGLDALIAVTNASLDLLVAAPGILAGGGAFLVLGAGALAAGVGLLALSGGVSALTITGQAIMAVGDGITAVATSVQASTPIIATAFNNMITQILTTLTSATPMFLNAGVGIIINGFLPGLKSKETMVIIWWPVFIGKMLASVQTSIPQWNEAGGNLVNGLIVGLQGKEAYAIQAARRLAQQVLNSMKSTMGINSPSDETAWMAKMDVLGLSGGFEKYGFIAVQAASNVGEETIEAMKNSMSGISDVLGENIEVQPVIKPVLDLTNVETGAKTLNSKFDGINVATSQRKASSAATPESANNESGQKNQNGTNVTLYQYNNSPKALSRIDIYRQTKNQLATVKGVVKQND